MGIYLLNISVDAADPNPQNIPEDLTFNDQESIIEIVVEKVFGFEDAIEEYDDHDSEDPKAKKTIDKINLTFHFSFVFTNSQSDFYIQRHRHADFEVNLTKGFFQLHNPPPQICFQQT